MRKLETVDRALQLLQAFSDDSRELTVGALATALDVHPSSVSRLVGTLAERGFLERVPGGDAWRLGPELVRLGTMARGSVDLITAARSPMDSLAGATGETVVLSTLDQGEAVDVAQVDGPHLISARQWIGRRAPLHASSDGKVLMAFAEGRPAELTRETDRTLTTRKELDAEIAEVRRRGWATAESEMELGLSGVAAPVRDHLGRCVAALSISGPEYRLSAERLEAAAGDVVAAAATISEALGLRRPSSQ
ncbi:IclR family transcriptional regulator [Brevibacterium metallidurans]|uniref:IclR family transcriptional regulator n=1 Tax=Brevibacterium metallidurans TaxID=1482676 RepID=UPI0030D8B479